MQDSELLRAYHAKKSETAFEELVKRHVDLVYGAARRQAGNDLTAQEITQKVFCLLAQKSAALTDRPSIAGWLYRATCFLAAKELRNEARRRRRETETVTMNELASTGSPMWEQLSPLLDELLNELPERDRTAAILRFFQRKSMSEVAAVLGVSEAAAKMRVGRAVERLRKAFAKRGVACTASVLATTMTEKAAPAVPATVTSSVLVRLAAVGPAATTSALSWIETWRLMSTPAMQLGATLALSGLLCVGVVGSAKYLRFGTFSIPANREAAANNDLPGQTAAGTNAETQPTVSAAAADEDTAELVARLKAALHAPFQAARASWPNEGVLDAITAFGRKSPAAFDVLKEASQDPDGVVRVEAVAGMNLIARKVPQVVPFLWELLRNPQSFTTGVTHGDMSMPKMNNSAIPFMNEIFLSVGDVAFTSLGNSDLTARDLPAFTELLISAPNWNTIGRYSPEVIAKILENDTAASELFVPAIEALLDHTNDAVRFRAACALAKYEAATNPKVLAEISKGLAVPPVRVLQDDPDFAEKRRLMIELGMENLMALETLERIGPAAAPLVPQLRDFSIATKQDMERQIAFRIIGKVDPDSRKQSSQIDAAVRLDIERDQWRDKLISHSLSLDDMVSALNDEQRVVLAASQLGEMGDAAKPAIPSLIAALTGKGDDDRNDILKAIHAIDPTVKVETVKASVVGAAIDAALQATLDSTSTRSDAQNTALFRSLQKSTNDMALAVSQWTYKEMTDFANMIGAQDTAVRQAFIDKAIEKDANLKRLFVAEH